MKKFSVTFSHMIPETVTVTVEAESAEVIKGMTSELYAAICETVPNDMWQTYAATPNSPQMDKVEEVATVVADFTITNEGGIEEWEEPLLEVNDIKTFLWSRHGGACLDDDGELEQVSRTVWEMIQRAKKEGA